MDLENERFEELNDKEIEGFIDGAIPIATKRQTKWGISLFKGKTIQLYICNSKQNIFL